MGEWQPIESAPKDGKPFFVWADGYEWPEVIQWFVFDDETAKEAGEPGYWHYADANLQEICDPIDMAEYSHWHPLLAPPAAQRDMEAAG